MRSWRELAVLSVLVAACGVEYEAPPGSGTGDDDDDVMHVDPDVCETSFLDYDNFGAPFVINWCRGCHSSSVPAGMRQKAPAAVNFDDAADVRAWGDRIRARAASLTPSMPPAGGPTASERELLAEWIACGAR